MEKEKAKGKDKEGQPRLQQREETKKKKAPKAESYSDIIAFTNFYNRDARGKRELATRGPSSSRNKVALRLEERWQQQDESPKENPKELDRPQRRTLLVVDCAERRPAVT